MVVAVVVKAFARLADLIVVGGYSYVENVW